MYSSAVMKLLLAVFVAGVSAAPELQFTHAGASCSIQYDGTTVSTSCPLGSGFMGTTPLTGPPTNEQSELVWMDTHANSCGFYFDGTALNTDCNLAAGFSTAQSNVDVIDTKVVFDDVSSGKKCAFAFETGDLSTDCTLAGSWA